MKLFFNFFLPALVAWFCATVTFLIGRSVGAATFAGVCCGAALALAYEFGKNEGFKLKYVLTELIGGVLGGALGGLMFLANG